MIIDKARWRLDRDANRDEEGRGFKGYGGTCIRVAGRVMSMLDREGPTVDARKLVDAADDALIAGITGFMAGAIASLVSRNHHRGEEFRRSWNLGTAISDEGEKANDNGGILNPALLNIGVPRRP